jgi:hypothetical protein
MLRRTVQDLANARVPLHWLESKRGGKIVDRIDQAIAALKAETRRLEQELKQVRAAITGLEGASNNGRGITARLSGRTLSASARRRIAAAQKARWAKWRTAQRKRAAKL